MSSQMRNRVREDLDVMGRFSRSYRERFAAVIRELNAEHPTPQAGGKALRLCVEAMDMVLAMQERLTEALAGEEGNVARVRSRAA
jgi:hypothetical protein